MGSKAISQVLVVSVERRDDEAWVSPDPRLPEIVPNLRDIIRSIWIFPEFVRNRPCTS
jgi:hypothetical protein